MNSLHTRPVSHIVMWKLRQPEADQTRAQSAAQIKEALEGMTGKIPGLLQVEVGIDTRQRANSFDVVMTSRFESASALEAYHDHPAHVSIIPLVSRLAETSVVVDYPAQSGT